MLAPIAIGCVMNQSYGHWLFGDTLQFIPSTCGELCDEIAHYIFLQFGWFGCNYFLCKVGRVTNLHEMSNFTSVFTFHFFAWF
jgi:hypothetical protein